MSQEITVEIESPVENPGTLLAQAMGILGARVIAVAMISAQVTFVLDAPYNDTDQATCESILAGTTTVPLAVSPATPLAGDNVVVTIGDAAGDYTWTWMLNGVEIASSDTAGVATTGDYTLDVDAIESGVHEITVRQTGLYGYLKIEVN